ncbi:SDR family oxidoreductase [Actinoplanes sp. NBRC 103695]|uniref:SDR family oxidoreductase n=1 Tax=Actinoplanes sp. NBRC 103695 TaxID=3032202 RepID=UPI0024A324D0|nr:SDR family oxidoreductase [Actinoplanes sp. NBRC 103695]GLZ00721.1 short-chain dehydrogenase [Actinoplanes sp. NBRC 103695]
MGDLTGRTAVVTGSSRGIGRSIAHRLAADGALVAVHSGTDTTGLDETVASIRKAGGRAFPVVAQLGVPDDAATLVSALHAGLEQHGDRSELDILVNNAGVLATMPPEMVTPAEFDRVMAINAKAPFFIVQHALPMLARGGRIINISTGLTRFANPQEIAHAMAKAALEMITLHLARHLGPRGITVNTVAPGVVDNGDPFLQAPELRRMLGGLSAFDRIGEPDDIADIVAFLAATDGRWITGAWIDATGGTLLGAGI